MSKPTELSLPISTALLIVAATAVALSFRASLALTTFSEYRDGRLVIQDFFYYISAFGAYWRGEIESLYDPRSYSAVLSALAGGVPIQGNLPVAYTPIGLFLWLPFALLAESSARLSYAVFLALSWSAIIGMTALLLPRKVSVYVLLAVVACISSSAAWYCAVLGQTALLSSGLLGMLLASQYASSRALRTTAAAAVITVLSAKPNLYVLGVLIPFIFGRRREALIGVGCSVLALAFSALAMEEGFVGRYLQIISAYTARLDPQFTGIGYSAGTTFRSAFASVLIDHTALTISKVMFMLLLGGASLISFRATDNRLRHMALVAVFAAFLLFVPYAGFYEDLAIVPLVVFAFHVSQRSARFLAAAVSAVLLLNAELLLGPAWGPLAGFFLKSATLLLLLAGFARVSTEERAYS